MKNVSAADRSRLRVGRAETVEGFCCVSGDGGDLGAPAVALLLFLMYSPGTRAATGSFQGVLAWKLMGIPHSARFFSGGSSPAVFNSFMLFSPSLSFPLFSGSLLLSF